MANPSPSVYFPGISKNANSEIVFTTGTATSPSQTATFPLLTNTEASPSTGDIRKIAYAILYQIAINHTSLSSKPVFSSSSSKEVNAEFPNYIRSITLEFTITPSGQEVILNEA